VVSTRVPGFLPSTAGLAFPNAFSHTPVRSIGIPGLVTVPIGDAADGLCGGMVFAARDYFEAGRPPPPDPDPPAGGTPMFDYLVRRLFDSFDLPRGPVRYLELMNPALPDGDGLLARVGLVPHGRAWRMIRDEWPKIRAELDGGRPCPLGLVRIRSLNPFDLKHNHQVLAYGYDLDGPDLTLWVYDPNRPGDDRVTVSLSLGDPRRATAVATTIVGRPIVALFRVGYRPASPP
jgi:hypothetical protein